METIEEDVGVVAVITVVDHEREVAELKAIIAAMALKFGGGVMPLCEDDLKDVVGQRLAIDFGKPLSGLTIRVTPPPTIVAPLPQTLHKAPGRLQ